MSILQKLKDSTIPSAFSAVAGVGVYYLLVDGDLTSSVPFANMNLPVWGAVAGSVFIGSEVGELLNSFVVPKIPYIKDLTDETSMVIPPVSAGLSTYLAMRLLISSETEFKNSFIIGAGANLVGQLAYTKI